MKRFFSLFLKKILSLGKSLHNFCILFRYVRIHGEKNINLSYFHHSHEKVKIDNFEGIKKKSYIFQTIIGAIVTVVNIFTVYI